MTLEATTVRVSVRASSQSVEAIATRAPTLATSVASPATLILVAPGRAGRFSRVHVVRGTRPSATAACSG